MADLPPTRWSRAGTGTEGYGRTFAGLVSAGADVDGEARLADALVQRNARVLDVGAGMGRVAAALTDRGHRVVAVEPDPRLASQARRTYPGIDVVDADVLAVDAATLAESGRPAAYDLVVAVGNVLIFLGEGTERRVLAHLHGLLAPGGRLLAGYHPVDGPAGSRAYPPEEFIADAESAGLLVDLRAGTYQLHPPESGYAVFVLARAEDRTG